MSRLHGKHSTIVPTYHTVETARKTIVYCTVSSVSFACQGNGPGADQNLRRKRGAAHNHGDDQDSVRAIRDGGRGRDGGGSEQPWKRELLLLLLLLLLCLRGVPRCRSQNVYLSSFVYVPVSCLVTCVL